MSWFITGLNSLSYRYDCSIERTFGFYLYKSDVEEAIFENRGDMCECGFYDYLVVEYIPKTGIHPEVKEEIWYQWNNDKWIKCDKKPSLFVGLTNFALG
jgi:hypothetical protein